MTSRSGLLAGFALALAAAVGAWAAVADDADKKGAARAEALPADLARAPAKGLIMISLRPAELWSGSLGKGVRDKLGKDQAALIEAVKEEAGLPPADIERMTYVMSDPGARAPLLLVAAKTKADRKAVLAAVVPGAKVEKKGDFEIHAKERRAVVFLGDTVYAISDKEGLEALLDTKPGAESGGLVPGYALAAKKHALVLAVNPSAFPPVPNEVPDEVSGLLPLLKAELGTLTVDVGEKLSGKLHAAFPSDDEAKAGAKGLQAGQKMLGDYLQLAQKQLAQDKGSASFAALVKRLGDSLAAARPAQQGKVVTASVEMKLDAKTTGQVAADAVRKMREAATRMRSANNLKQLGLAFHNYHDTHNAFPPAAIYDKDGKALLSWRVVLLPFLDHNELYKKFKLNEAWDSEHNKKLLAEMPSVYAVPGRKTKLKHGTFYQVFVGKGAAFEGSSGLKLADFTDGTSNTILAAEAAVEVPWTKPDDLAFDPDKDLPKLGGLVEGSFQALFADGSVRHIRTAIKKENLKAMITRNGGEVFSDD